MRSLELSFALLLFATSSLDAQDLFSRDRDRGGARDGANGPGRDRLDLRLSADLLSAGTKEDAASTRIGVGAVLDADFACGRFDLKASLKSLFSRNVRDEFLGSVLGWIESELTRNALVLACEASPTVCQAIQHYRVQAQAMLGMSYDRCQSIQQAVDSSLAKQRAEAINACIEEKRRAGLPMDKAIEECNSPNKIKSLTGERVLEIDLVDELKRALKLSGEDSAAIDRLLGNRVKYTASGGAGEIARHAVEDEYKRLRKAYDDAWRETVADVADGRVPSAKALARLVPPQSPGVSVADLGEVAILPESRRAIVIASIASQSALLELLRRAHEVERSIEAARKLPTADESAIKKLERERDDLRAELARLAETHRRQNEFNRALLDAVGVARENVVAKSASAMEQLALDAEKRRFREETQRWGGGTPVAGSGSGGSTSGAGCGNCGSTSWSFGSRGGRK